MRDRVRELIVILVKGGVSAVAAWLGAKGIDVDPETVTLLEAGVAGLAVAVANWVLNVGARWARKIPKVGVIVDLVWPTPHYDKAELKAA